MKFSLIIQGPMVSSGVNGKGTQTVFNCENNILQILNDYGYLFHKIVLSTWRDENLSASFSDLVYKLGYNINILVIDKPKPVKGYFRLRSNNKNLQVSGIYHALESIKSDNSNEDMKVIRIRTDQYLRLDYLIEFANSNRFKSGVLYTPYYVKDKINKTILNFMADFYYLSDFNTIYNFFYFNHYGIEIVDNFHQDSIYKMLVGINPHLLNYKYLFNRSWRIYSNHPKELLKMYLFSFAPLTENVFKSVSWRGANYDSTSTEVYNRYIFHSEWINFIDYTSNANYRKMTNLEKLTLIDNRKSYNAKKVNGQSITIIDFFLAKIDPLLYDLPLRLYYYVLRLKSHVQ